MTQKNNQSLVVGLTGGIGSGKSTVSSYYHKHYGVPVVDADKLSRALVEKGSPVLDAMAETFGKKILLADGSLNRGYVRGLIADSSAVKKQIEAIQYPILQQNILDEIAACKQAGAPLVIYDCPIFFQTHQEKYVDKIAVVICRREVRISRIVTRDDTTREMAEKMIDLQLSDEAMAAQADIVIDNSGEADALYRTLDALADKFKKI